MRRCYHEKGGHVAKPTQHDETKTRQEYETLFTAEEPPGQDVAINIDPFSIDDNNEEKIRKIPSKMKRRKAPGGSGITVEFLQFWMREKEQENPRLEILAAWKNVVDLIPQIMPHQYR
jgi:hypothetical protein